MPKSTLAFDTGHWQLVILVMMSRNSSFIAVPSRLWQNRAMQVKDAIPVTILTGFLGAGKTTLLNQLVSQKHGYNWAIIINEFGAISIDHQLVVGVDEEILELYNGCLCCRVRGDLIKSLSGLLRK